MNHVIENSITRWLCEKGFISYNDKDLYAFGIRQFISTLVCIITNVFIGMLFNMVIESVIFCSSYMLLRQYAGGYHASTQKTCYLLSVLLMCIAMIIVKNVQINMSVLVVALVVSLTIIFIKAPVESKSKPLTRKERKVYKKYACVISIAEGISTVIVFYLSFHSFAVSILTAIIMAATLLLYSDQNQISLKNN